MNRLIIAAIIVVWFCIGIMGSLKTWRGDGLDVTTWNAPVVFVLGGALGPILWIEHLYKWLIPEIMLIERPKK